MRERFVTRDVKKNEKFLYFVSLMATTAAQTNVKME
jgi:tryptophan synthase alpha subunit